MSSKRRTAGWPLKRARSACRRAGEIEQQHEEESRRAAAEQQEEQSRIAAKKKEERKRGDEAEGKGGTENEGNATHAGTGRAESPAGRRTGNKGG